MPDMDNPQMPASVTLDDVEIMAVGTWNGDEYTDSDLRQMVEALETQGFTPPVKLGHSEEQKLLQSDGLPAAGWVTKLRVAGGKLLATLTEVPQKLAELIRRGAYRQRSAEVYWNYRKTPESPLQRRVLAALSILGADVPAVKDMTPLDAHLALYAPDGSEAEERREIVVAVYAQNEPKNDGGQKAMPDPDQGKTPAPEVTKEDLKKLTDQLAEFKVSLSDKDEEIKKLRSELTVERTVRHSESVANFIARAKRDGKLAPAEEPLAKVLLESADRTKKVKYSHDDEETEGSSFELFQKFILDRPRVFDAVSSDRGATRGEKSKGKVTVYDDGAGGEMLFDEAAAEKAQDEAKAAGKSEAEQYRAYRIAGTAARKAGDA